MPEPDAVCTCSSLQHGSGGLHVATQGRWPVLVFSVMSWAGRELPVCHHMPWALFVALDLHFAALPRQREKSGNKDGLDSGDPPAAPVLCVAFPSPGPAPRLCWADTHLHQVDSEGLFWAKRCAIKWR